MDPEDFVPEPRRMTVWDLLSTGCGLASDILVAFVDAFDETKFNIQSHAGYREQRRQLADSVHADLKEL